MKLTPKQRKFVSRNRKDLLELFTSSIDDLRDRMEVCPTEKTEPMKLLIKEFRDWLILVGVCSKKKKDKQESFI
jgi:hypothetical protein